MKKFTTLLCIIFLISLIMSCISYATSKDEITMTKIAEDPVEFNFGSAISYPVSHNSLFISNSGTFSKELTAFDGNAKYTDITLTVTNNQRAAEIDDLELVLLMDVSNSTASNTKLTTMVNCANKLVDDLLTANEDTKIGIVKFATSLEEDSEGFFIEGTEKDAEVVSDLTSSKSTLTSKLTDLISDTGMGIRTNLDAGLKQAETLLNNSATESHNKQIIIFTDAIPNTIVGTKMTAENAYSQTAILKPTRDTLLNTSYGEDRQSGTNDDVKITSLLIDITTDHLVNPLSSDFLGMTKKEAAEYIFGTEMDPTVGSVYYIETAELSEIVENIYNSMTANYEIHTLTDIVVTDVFPEEIVNAFDISVIEITHNSPSSSGILIPAADGSYENVNINLNSRSLQWTIPKLETSETMSLVYRLSLKSDVDDNYINIDINTNDSVSLSYKEDNVSKDPVISAKTNVIHLSANSIPIPTPVNNTTPVPVNNASPVQNITPVDNTVAQKPIPQTGTSFQKTASFAGIVLSSIGLFIFSAIRMKQSEK